MLSVSSFGSAAGPLPKVRPPQVVMADDDRSEHLLMLMAVRDAKIQADFEFLEDGADLLLHLIGKSEDELPDLIILDLRMPGLDGHATLDELQVDPLLWQIPVVVFTSSPRSVDFVESQDRGAVSYYTKPSDFKEMVEMVVEMFARLDCHDNPYPQPTQIDSISSGLDDRRVQAKRVHDSVDTFLEDLNEAPDS